MTTSLVTLQKYKAEGRRFSVLTSYDASFAHLMSKSGIDVLLVGDSLGNVIQGQNSTVPVTLEQMVYHTENSARGNQGSLLISDVPFMEAATVNRALNAATHLMQAGANVVKMEGGAWLDETVALLKRNGVPTCVHLGLTPQSVNTFGGYRIQGRENAAAEQLVSDMKVLDEAGAALFVLECIPATLGKRATQAVAAPVISCGAGPDCDGQVVVTYDMLGLSGGKLPKFVKNFMEEAGGNIGDAIRAYHQAVVNGSFPAPEHCY
jgi:3-methyl-2-oxobutanoate hydroxymethyltransferase